MTTLPVTNEGNQQFPPKLSSQGHGSPLSLRKMDDTGLEKPVSACKEVGQRSKGGCGCLGMP